MRGEGTEGEGKGRKERGWDLPDQCPTRNFCPVCRSLSLAWKQTGPGAEWRVV